MPPGRRAFLTSGGPHACAGRTLFLLPITRMAGSSYDPRYLEGIEHFNRCDFYEAHEVWEDLWADTDGPDKRFYQGLIQVAVCLHHFGNGNIRGARKLYHSCRGYLEAYRPRHLGLDVDKLLAELAVCCKEILESPEEFPRIEIVPDLIPEIHLQEEHEGPP